MLIGLISDTHDHVPHIKEAVGLFKERDVDLVIHSGDFCSPFTIPLFEELALKAIFGNNDGDAYLLMKKCREIGAELLGDFFEFDADGCRIAVYHGTYPGITDALHRCGKYDVVISGHTHEKSGKHMGETLAVNPGSAHGFDSEATIAFLETENRKVEFIPIG